MDLSIAALLTQDGITNGAVYALLALALVLVFAVTRVVWIPSGEFVAYGTLTLAGLQLGKPPGTVGLLVGMAVLAGVMEAYAGWKRGEIAQLPRRLLLWTGVPLAIAGAVALLAPMKLPLAAQIVLTLAAVTALGPLLYRIAYQPLADASVLVLLIVSVAVHFVLTGLGLWFFGAEGSRTGHIGMGLGFFISKTLLERTGAALAFLNRPAPDKGAVVRVRWARGDFETTAESILGGGIAP